MKTLIVGLPLVLTVLIAAPARAQNPTDARWSNWLGCWDLVADEVKDELPSPEAAVEAGRAGRPVNGRGARICVTPAASERGVVLTTLVGGQSVLEQTIVADGTARPISDPACRGTQKAEWSKDGLRLFSHAELSCPNQPQRTVSGLSLFATNGQWIDVQAVTIASRDSVRVRRYRRGADQPRTANGNVGTRLTLENVKEASAKVSSPALEAALVETHATFPLNGKALLDLDKAGVPDNVVDLMVALSFPKAFAVERITRDDRVTPLDFYPFSGAWALGYPLWPYGFEHGFNDYYWSPYYYSPFGYRYLGIYPEYYGSTAVILNPSDGGSTKSESPGRVINGLGYTRVTPRTTEDASSTSGNSGGRSSGRGSVSAEGWSSGSSSSGSSGGSGGASSEGGGGGGGRTAVDR